MWLTLLLLLSPSPQNPPVSQFDATFAQGVERTWIGPEFYANRLQDWRLQNGWAHCLESRKNRPMRVLHLLAARMGAQKASFQVEVEIKPGEGPWGGGEETWAGFLVGAGGEAIDYRLTALTHGRAAADGGFVVALDGAGRLVARDFEKRKAGGLWSVVGELAEGEMAQIPAQIEEGQGFGEEAIQTVRLRILAEPGEQGYRLEARAVDLQTGRLIRRAVWENLAAEALEGEVALVSHRGPKAGGPGYAFHQWQLSGGKLQLFPERRFGPIAGNQYIVHRGVLKMTVQMMPVGAQDPQAAALEVWRPSESSWQTLAWSSLEPDSRTFSFQVEGWDASKARRYRVRYGPEDQPGSAIWEGTLQADPVDKSEVVVAAFTGNKHYTGGLQWNSNGLWFPHQELVQAVTYHQPDLLFFSGDQIYEGDLTGAQRRPLEGAMLDYLDKWYRWCWTFRDLTKNLPTLCIPDDHDVYHGNIWGAGGRAAKNQDAGGYTMPARFVNMVQRTQTSHLPRSSDPAPVEQGIGVYFCSFDWGGLSFAVLEDRKFKSSPTVMCPEGECKNGWFRNPDFDPVTQADVEGAVLLGERQLRFLERWAEDWQPGVWMKVALSQTIFANVATLPAPANNDAVVPRLRVVEPGEYPETDIPAADGDSNGWPQSGRNRALRALRKAFAFHIAGDQHLGSFIRYGVESWEDAGYAFCVPSIANTWPRRWFPPERQGRFDSEQPEYTGQFRDGFGNYMTVHAVSNPVRYGQEPAALYDRAPGYGIIRFRRGPQQIEVECWPRWQDPKDPQAEQYPGWPQVVHARDQYAKRPTAWLPAFEVKGMARPVLKVRHQQSGELVYSCRLSDSRVRPWVFEEGLYQVGLGEPATGRWREFDHLEASREAGSDVISVVFE
ncbi:MAG: twin-arginine translocation pathway signal protein [Planctomycetota bacterium]|nr:MAG: twin-arginine translocation pathway signal protein [Planctomycetota bacterium]